VNNKPSPKPFSKLTLRQETREDRDWLLDLYADCRREELEATGIPELLRRPFIEQQFQLRQAAYRTAFHDAEWSIVCVDEQCAGRLILHRTSCEWRIVDLALRPEYRGRQLGTRLLRGLQDEAAQAGRPLRLQALPENPAVRLYRRLGFVVTGEDNLRLQMEWNPLTPQPCQT